MDIDFQSNNVTLDWDNISIDTAKKQAELIFTLDENVKTLVLYQSARKGFHCDIYTFRAVHNAGFRRKWKDDGLRIIHDLLQDNDVWNDLLFTCKIDKHGLRWDSHKIMELQRFKAKCFPKVNRIIEYD